MPPASTAKHLRSLAFQLLRLAFRAIPMSTARRDSLREWFLSRYPRIRPALPQGQPRTSVERRPRVHSGGRAIGYVERRDEPLPDPLPATLVAFYLPQFHTIPENDEWWGKGFTEWRNVARALPQFEGHNQPRLPGDLGFYDLRNPQVLRDQAELAQAYGIGAFCMYFYWFGGKTLLELPHQQWLDDPSISLPICLCWANEDWTRTWDGRAGEVLIAQKHSPEDDLAFIAHVARYLRDPRYLRVDGKPLVLVYRPGKLPDPRATAERWRTWCRDNSIGEIFLAYVQAFERPDPREIGFDAAVEFPPNLSTAASITHRQSLFNPDYQGEVLDWRELARDFAHRPMPEYTLFPGVNCGWDNEPRRPGRGRTYVHASLHRYRDWVQRTTHGRLASAPRNRRIAFINAWNEWAEGALLEPDLRWGHAWLDATRAGIKVPGPNAGSITAPPCVVIHAWYPDILEEMLQFLRHSAQQWRLVVTTSPEREVAIRKVMAAYAMPAEIHVFPNRGRDILPFLQAAHTLRLDSHDVVLKLHTKRSPHRRDGDRWRNDILRSLASPERVARIQRAFEKDPTLGIVAPEGHLRPLHLHWGANKGTVERLLTYQEYGDVIGRPQLFVAGSMYWVRLKAIDRILDFGLREEDFEPESAQIDGTLAHAIERLICVVSEASGYRVTTASAACGDKVAEQESETPYPYT